MSRPRGQHAEFEALLDEARRNEAGSPPRKHHLVPASYLRRWAEDGKVRVTVVDEARSYTTSPEKAARETDYYRIEHPDVDPDEVPPLLFETMLSKIEGNAKTVTDELLEHFDPRRVAPEKLAMFAWHLAISITRGAAFRAGHQEGLNDMLRLQWEGVTDDEGLRRLLRENGMEATPGEVARHREFLDDLQAGRMWAEQPAAAVIAMSGEAAVPLGEYLFSRKWKIYETPPILVTCDEPVVIMGGPGSPRGERSGVAEAGAVIYPLSPSALLVMFHPRMQPQPPAALDHVETADINKEIIASAFRWAFERPSRRVTERLRVPPLPPKPRLREELPTPDGGPSYEVYRLFKPTRWSQCADPPPWPVGRWWGGWWARQFPRLNELPSGAKVMVDGRE